MSVDHGNAAWRALSDSPRYKSPRQPGVRGRGWLAVATDPRGPANTYRQLVARRVADATTEDDSIQRVLALFWDAAKCATCGRTGDCGHRDRRTDLAEIMAERKAGSVR